jgi:hypothetical protein
MNHGMAPNSPRDDSIQGDAEELEPQKLPNDDDDGDDDDGDDDDDWVQCDDDDDDDDVYDDDDVDMMMLMMMIMMSVDDDDDDDDVGNRSVLSTFPSIIKFVISQLCFYIPL